MDLQVLVARYFQRFQVDQLNLAVLQILQDRELQSLQLAQKHQGNLQKINQVKFNT